MVDVSLAGEFVRSVGRVQVSPRRDARLGRVWRVALAARELVVRVVVVAHQLRQGIDVDHVVMVSVEYLRPRRTAPFEPIA